MRAPLSRAEQLATVIEARIRDEQMAPGNSIGTLEDLGVESGYSRPTVSEAVLLLRDRGFVHIKPGRGGGLFVADRGPIVRLRHTLLSVDEDPNTVADAVELRDHLELLVALGAARSRTDTDTADLRRLCVEMGKAEGWPNFLAANWMLHERIAGICPNAMARAVYTSTLGHISSASPAYDDGPEPSGYQASRHLAHIELVEAIASADEDRIRIAVRQHNRPTP